MKEWRVIDVDAVRGDLCTAQLEDIGERHCDRRAIVARVGHDSLTGYRCGPAPGSQQLMPTRDYRCEEPCHGRTNRLVPNDHRGITEAELRIRSQKIQEACRLTSIDAREQTLPPCVSGLKGMLRCDSHAASILEAI
jgi:hypothetical protein